jgi:hypothetical protein
MAGAAMDLGLGANLRLQLANEQEERKKKLLRQAKAQQSGLSPGTMALFPGASTLA